MTNSVFLNGYETQYSMNYPFNDFLTLTAPQNPQLCNQQIPQVQSSPQISYVPVLVSQFPCLNSNTLCPPNTSMPLFSLTPSAVINPNPAPVSPQRLEAPPTIFHQNVIIGGNSPDFQPVPMSTSPSPIFGAVPEPTFFQRTPSPSPSLSPQTAPALPNVKPDLSQCRILFELEIIRHQATVRSINEEHSGEIADAMRSVLNTNIWYLFVVVTEQDNSMTIQWAVHPNFCDFETLRQITQTKDFEKRLICRLAHVGNGAFNKHLHGSKQLTIISEGRKCFERLKNALESYNEAKNNLLGSHTNDTFDPRNVEDLLRVCEAPRGCALRGENVVGGHFRGGDVLRLTLFIDIVEATIGTIKKATMIPSMKGKAQYKGWSIYVETPSVEHVKTIIEACETCSFEKAEIFVAVDKFRRRNE